MALDREDIDKLHPEVAEVLRWDLSSRWQCLVCGEVTYLVRAFVIGNYCCGGCGMTCLRPWRYELPAVA